MTKRYTYGITEEMIQAPDFAGYAGGRIEVFDSEDKKGWPIYEGRFLIPLEIFGEFRNMVEEWETDRPIYLRMEVDGIEGYDFTSGSRAQTDHLFANKKLKIKMEK